MTAYAEKKGCQMLVNRGYLTHHPQLPDEPDELEPDDRCEPPDELEDRYAPTQKLVNRMIESRRKADERRKANQPPTH